MRKDVLAEHGAQGHDLGVSGHDAGHDRGPENARHDDISVVAEQAQDDVVGFTKLEARKLMRGDDTEVHAGQPDEQNADGIPDHGAFERRDLFRCEAHDGHVGKHHRRERDKGVAEELLRRDARATQEGRVFRVRCDFGHDLVVAPEVPRDEVESDRAETKEEHGLQRIYPCHAAHAAKENVEHNNDGDDRAAEPVRHPSIAETIEGVAAAHHADDDIRDHHQRSDGKDEGADAIALPAVAEILHLRHVAVLFSKRPEPRADEENGERNDESRRRGHEPVSANAALIGEAGAAENGEGRHVRNEDREQKHPRSQRPARQKKVFLRASAFAEGEHPDIEDNREVNENDDGGDHGFVVGGCWSSGASSSRCAGQAKRTSSAMVNAASTE